MGNTKFTFLYRLTNKIKTGLTALFFIFLIVQLFSVSPYNSKTINFTEDNLSGLELYLKHCKVCHGQDGLGRSQNPSLVDSEWIYGDQDSTVSDVIGKGRYGRFGRMPAYESKLNAAEIERLVEYLKKIR